MQDKIAITIQKDGSLLEEATKEYKDYICRETQALSLNMVEHCEEGLEMEIDDFKVRIKVEKLNNA